MITTWPSGNLSFTACPAPKRTAFTTQFEGEKKRRKRREELGGDERETEVHTFKRVRVDEMRKMDEKWARKRKEAKTGQRRQISKRDPGEVTGLEGLKCGKEQMEVLETTVNG